jgi:tetratricopeptide (TPR) repeat protein
MSSIPVEARALNCPSCGALVGKDDDRCSYCGASLIGMVGRLRVATPQMAQAVAEGLSYYETLEVGPFATQDEMELAYHRQLQRWLLTPLAMADEAKRHIELIEQAFAVLGDPSKRSTYDTTIRYGVRYAPEGEQKEPQLDGPEILAHGKSLISLKMYDQAATIFRKARQVMPESAEAHYLYALSCLEARRDNIFGIAPSECREIIQEMTTAQALDPQLVEAPAYSALARALLSQLEGDEGQARQHIKEAIYCKPDWALPYHVLAGFAFQSGDLDLAEKSCGQALRLEPDNASVQFILDNIRQRAEHTGKAKKEKRR